ncbi:hypothetical protein H9P43_004309 [Blastocladiella emersonii ATCC 22665]|nr:hypothetical protein H9P43_004309 [Blastocladiella emersonii ATCC 22665]
MAGDKKGKPKKAKKKARSKSRGAADDGPADGSAAAAHLTAVERDALARRQLLLTTLKAAAPSLADELGEMNEFQLRQRLEVLDDELRQYKEMVDECKKENDTLRQEIEDAQRDSAEYTAYLLLKRAEKQAVIDRMNGEHDKSMAEYHARRAEIEAKLNKEAQEITDEIADLQEKLDSKNQEILSLADVLHQRQRHEAQLAAYRKDLESLQASHTRSILELERRLLEERVRVQRRSDAQVAAMQAAAQQQALASLAEHTQQLAAQNDAMAVDLRAAVAATMTLQQRKHALEMQCTALEQELAVRERMVAARTAKVAAVARAGPTTAAPLAPIPTSSSPAADEPAVAAGPETTLSIPDPGRRGRPPPARAVASSPVPPSKNRRVSVFPAPATPVAPRRPASPEPGTTPLSGGADTLDDDEEWLDEGPAGAEGGGGGATATFLESLLESDVRGRSGRQRRGSSTAAAQYQQDLAAAAAVAARRESNKTPASGRRVTLTEATKKEPAAPAAALPPLDDDALLERVRAKMSALFRFGV